MLFLSTYINKIDRKGRVSVPSNFRVLLAQSNFSGVIAYQSIGNQCIEACSYNRIIHMSASIDNLDPYSDERDAFATVILGGSVKLSFDREGRIILPETLLDFSELQDKACFVGKGQTFEIWQPELFQEHYNKSKAVAEQKKLLLRLTKKDNIGVE